MADKKANLACPGIGPYEEVERVPPDDNSSLLNPKETQQAIGLKGDFPEEKYFCAGMTATLCGGVFLKRPDCRNTKAERQSS